MIDTFTIKIICNYIVSALSATYFANVIKLKFNKFLSIIIITIVMCTPITLLNIFITKENTILRPISGMTGIFLALILVGKDNSIKTYIKHTLIVYGIMLLADIVTHIYFNILSNCTNYESNDVFALTTISVLAIGVECLVSIIIIMSYLVFKKKIKGKMKYQTLILLNLIPLSHIVLLTAIYVYAYQSAKYIIELYSVVCVIISFITNVLIYEMIANSEEYYKKKKEVEFLKEREDMIHKYYELAISNKEELTKLRHDMKNELQIVYALMDDEEGKYKAKDMAKQMEDKIDQIGRIEYSKNPILNSLLGIKVAQASERKIKLNIEIEKDKLALEDIDICNIFSNLIDNSINACKNVEEKIINLKISNKIGYSVINIENPYIGEIKQNSNNEIITTNKNQSNHGYGLKIVKSIVEKYRGELQINYENDTFKVLILIPEKGEKNE